MPHVPVPNGVQVELRFTQDAQKVENVHWFLAPEPVPSATSLQTIATMVYDWWVAQLRALQSTTAILREVYATDQSSATGGVYTVSPAPGSTGLVVTEQLPNAVTACVSLRTAKRGRSYRGRVYFIGLTENNVQGNALGTQFAVALLDAYDDLISIAAAAGTPLCICSRFAEGDVRAAGVLTPVTDAVLVDGTVDTQRRRAPGRGN